MIAIDADLIGKRIRLETRAPSALRLQHEGRLTAIMDPGTARLLADIYHLHAVVYPFLDSSVPDDARAYNYLKLEAPDGSITVLGVPWIDPNSVSVLTGQRTIITVDDWSDTDRIRNALSANGVTGFKIRVESM